MRLAIVLVAFLILPTLARADAFDNYTNEVLLKVPKAKGVEAIKKLTPELMVEHSRALPGITATFLVVKTNEGRMSKLLVLPARQKINADDSTPILMIERFTTYREGEEKTLHAQGQNLRLFDNFRFNLDIGQVVPEALGADLKFVVEKDGFHLEPVGKAELFVVTKHLPEAIPKKAPKLVIGEKFEARFFTGSYKLYDDGRRTGTLKLTVEKEGDVVGFYYSDKDGQKYEVTGKIGNPNHSIQFTITFPRSMQQFQGLLFTGDGQAIVGSSRFQERETGFYAIRQE